MTNVSADAFIKAAQSKEIVTYLDLVAAVILGYDYILSLGDEIKHMWFTPLSLGKVLYFLTRYPVTVDTTLVLYHQFAILSPAQCDTIYKTIGYSLGCGTFIAESILVMRTWVLWDRNLYVGIGLCSTLVLAWVPVFYFLSQSLNSLVFANAPYPNMTGCFLHTQKNILYVVWIIITTFESIILIFTLIKFAPVFGRKKSTLIRVIYRDGFFNYIYLCMLSIFNIIVLFTAPRGYTTLLSALQRVFHALLSSRVLLNLRQAASNPFLVDTGMSETYGGHSQVLFHPWTTTFNGGENTISELPMRTLSRTNDDDDSADFPRHRQFAR